MKSSPHDALACLCVILAAACSSGSQSSVPQTLKIHDDGIVMPTLRADYGFGQARSADGAKIGRFGLTVEATRAEGNPSPASDYSMLSVQALGRFRFVDEPQVRGQLLFGFEYLDLDAEVRSGSLAFNRSRGSIGPALGLDLGLRIVGPLEAYGHGTVSAMLLATTSARGELGLRAELGQHANIFAGYRWWDLRQEDVNLLLGPDRDLEIRTEGLVLGMGFRF